MMDMKRSINKFILANDGCVMAFHGYRMAFCSYVMAFCGSGMALEVHKKQVIDSSLVGKNLLLVGKWFMISWYKKTTKSLFNLE